MLIDFIKRYFLRAFLAASVYCIMVVIFLVQKQFQSLWLLFLGNALYLAAMAVVIFLSNRAEKIDGSPLKSAISGHVLSLTGAAISVVLSIILYFLFYAGIDGSKGEALQQAPANISANGFANGMLFMLIVIAALGNTITGFFAAIFTSFSAGKRQENE